MEVTFSSPALAALCNSEHHLAVRWGPSTGRAVGRRLLELSACDAEAVCRLPRASVTLDGDGVTVIDFDGKIEVRGLLSEDCDGGDLFVITRLAVHVSTEI